MLLKLPNKIHSQKNFIAKLPFGGDSLFLAELTQNSKAPLLCIVNDAYQLNRLYDEIKFFNPHARLGIFSSYEVLAYERQSPYKDLIANRLQTLWGIQQKSYDIVLIQADTVSTLLPPCDYFNKHVLCLKVGAKLDITLLRQQLISVGYQLVNKVYEAGEFAIRGSIIDVMPMGSHKAIRIDLFDDEIESLFWLDATSQSTLEDLTEIQILPSREYSVDNDSFGEAVNRFISYFPKWADSQLVKDIKRHILPAGNEFYLPLFFERCATIFDYLDKNWQIIYSANLSQQLALNWQEINQRYQFYSYQYPCIEPKDLFLQKDTLLHNLKNYTVWEIADSGEMYAGFKPLFDVAVDNKIAKPFDKLSGLLHKHKVIICASSLGRVEILRQTLGASALIATHLDGLSSDLANGIYLVQANLHQGFICGNYIFITEGELYPLGAINKRKINRSITKAKANSDLIVRDLAEIKVGDLVVHLNHGIGCYNGLISQQINDMEYEMIEVIYQNNSKLFIPVHNLHLISRYSHLENNAIELTKLGSKQWDKIKQKAEQKVNDIAAELLELYATREIQRGFSNSLPEEYPTFANSFGYETTEDQQNSIDEIIKDMANIKPMDRLICGDVGFGKTEVAMRAIFIAAMNGYQVAILAPTTLLVEQLYQNLVNRFTSFALVIAEVSRFKTKKEVTQTLELLTNGKVDIIVGTHRLIQDDVKFSRLGLVVIDEEHRFGVKQKERFKQMRSNVDVLTMTATPIPRTLSMALDGIRDFSIIATPPSRRLPVNTVIIFDDNVIIREAILREIRRGGQVFFLYNDVATIEQMHDKLVELMPELRIAIAHGQMRENELEQTIKDFINQRFNLLLCSTIIETGIDIANANTILIYRADKFGLAQLHQLRGRVGRSHHQAYCYLIVPEQTTKDAEKRLDAIVHTAELGAGFNLAMHDLEIRGAGEILGDNQAGNIKEVGLSLYTQMLKKAVNKLKNSQDKLEDANELYCEVNLNSSTILPVDYCSSVHERLIYYKRLATSSSNEQIEQIYQDIIDSYGLPPEPVKYLIAMHEIRLLGTSLGIQKIDANNASINLVFIDKPPIEPLKIVLMMQELRTCKYDGKNKLIWQIKSENTENKIKAIRKMLLLLTG